jgi:putative ABC transport system permease protein
MWLLTLRDLQYRRVRVIVVVLLAGVVMSMLYLMSGLVNQFQREPFDTTAAIGADHWVLPEGTSGPFTSGGAVPVELVDLLGGDAEPVVVARATIAPADDVADTAEVVLVGQTPDRLDATVADTALVEGRALTEPGEIVVDRASGYDVGDVVQLGPVAATVVGLTEKTTVLAGIPLVFAELTTAQDLAFQSRDVMSAAVVDGPRPDAPAGTVVRSAEEVADDALGPLEDAISSIDIVRVLLWLVAGVIIGAVVFLSALERQRDFAILRAMGTPKRTLLLAVAVQAMLIALIGAVLAMILQRLLLPLFPLPVVVPTRAYWQIPLGAVLVALVAGAVGLRKVATTDPATAFAGAGA